MDKRRAFNPQTGEIRIITDGLIPAGWIDLGRLPEPSMVVSGTSVCPGPNCDTTPTYRVEVTAVNWVPYLVLFLLVLVVLIGFGGRK